MKLSVKQIKKLREQTGAGIMQIKNALKQAKGDQEKVIQILRQQGQKLAREKQTREVKAGLVEAYVHSDGRVAALVALGCETDFVARNQEFKELAHNLAMQVVATDPKYLNPEEIPESILAKESEIYRQQVINEGKPKKIVESIISGKLKKYFAEVCLLKQPFIKDDKITIEQLLAEKINKLKEKVIILKFFRLQL